MKVKGKRACAKTKICTTADAASKYAARAAQAQSKWASGWAPYREVLVNLKLPPRGKRGSLENVERIEAVCTALHDEKLRQLRSEVVN